MNETEKNFTPTQTQVQRDEISGGGKSSVGLMGILLTRPFEGFELDAQRAHQMLIRNSRTLF